MGMMDVIVGHIRQFRQPFTDKSALWIKTFTLSRRVEDRKYGAASVP